MLPALPQVALALAGIEPLALGASGARLTGGERVREQIAWAGKQGVRAVQIDAMAAGVRPRELDRSGRRGLAALLRRNELACSGLDVFIPPEHFLDLANIDRAVSGVLAAIDMASEMAALSSGAVVTRFSAGELGVSVQLPREVRPDVRATIAARAMERGVAVADFAFPVEPGGGEEGALGVGIDPATVFAGGENPVALASRLGKRISAARLTDIARGIGAQRIAPGKGQLDVLVYLVALATGTDVRFAALDLRGVKGQAEAVASVRAAAVIP